MDKNRILNLNNQLNIRIQSGFKDVTPDYGLNHGLKSSKTDLQSDYQSYIHRKSIVCQKIGGPNFLIYYK